MPAPGPDRWSKYKKLSPAPDEPPPPPKPRGPYRSYARVPFLRRSETINTFVILHLLTLGMLPLLLVACFVILTGNVYYDRTDETGKLEVWGPTSKLAAFVILVINVVVLAIVIS